MSDVNFTGSGRYWFGRMTSIYANGEACEKLTIAQSISAASFRFLAELSDLLMIRLHFIIFGVFIAGNIGVLHLGVGGTLITLCIVSFISFYLGSYLSYIVSARNKYGIYPTCAVWIIVSALLIKGFSFGLGLLMTLDVFWIFGCIALTGVLILCSTKRFGDRHYFTAYLEKQKKINLLDFLPMKVRSKVIRISARDKYVSIKTERGSCELRMTLADAIRLNAAPGFKVHRSHWVSKAAPFKFQRRGKRLFLEIYDETIPVSPKIASRINSLDEM